MRSGGEAKQSIKNEGQLTKGEGTNVNTTSRRQTDTLVGAGRLERLLRPFHQRRAQRDCFDRAVSRRREDARRHCVRPHPAGARHRAADRQSLLRLPCLSSRQNRRAERRHRDAVWAERAAYVHRRVRHHAAGLSENAERATRLAGGSRLGVHHRHHRAARRVYWSDHSPAHAARSHAGYACRHIDRVHFAAARLPDVGGAMDLVHLARHRADCLDGECASCPAAYRADWPR